ncbi:hypothetical protein ACIQ6Y_00025 [Streptomyces sp. NPDC096205]|uniref:hypothetical protein n=1 Tax=Streptomyces sp. NPDC096205 TaxID=3366081 RepID=UPI003805A288
MTAADAPEEEPRGEDGTPSVPRPRPGSLSIWLGLLALLLGVAVVLGGLLSIGATMSPVADPLTVDVGRPTAEKWTVLPCPGDTGPASPACPRTPVRTARLHITVQARGIDVFVTALTLRPRPEARHTRPAVPAGTAPPTLRLPARADTELLAPARALLLKAGEPETFDVTLVDASGRSATEPWVATLCVRAEAETREFTMVAGDCRYGVLVHPRATVSSRAPGTPSAPPGPSGRSAGR